MGWNRIEPSTGNTPDGKSHLSPVWEMGKHCPELDGVRGLAILMVTMYRFTKEFDFSLHPLLGATKAFFLVGETGVDLFFVLSGFLITGILIQSRTRQQYLRNFMIRRSLRIFPLYFAMLALCLYIVPSLISTSVFNLPKEQQIYLWTYSSNIRMSWLNQWCFGPLDHFWSLAVEEHFYIIWPAVIYFFDPRKVMQICIAMVCSVLVIRMIAATRPELAVAVDVHTLFRCDALCMGAILSLAIAVGVDTVRLRRAAILLLPVLCITTAGLVLIEKRFLTIPSTLFPLLFMLGLAVLVSGNAGNRISLMMRLPLLRWLGKYSYGMYVFQLPLVTLFPLSNYIASGLDPLLVGYLYLVAMVGITSCLAYLSYHLFEKHFLDWKVRFT